LKRFVGGSILRAAFAGLAIVSSALIACSSKSETKGDDSDKGGHAGDGATNSGGDSGSSQGGKGGGQGGAGQGGSSGGDTGGSSGNVTGGSSGRGGTDTGGNAGSGAEGGGCSDPVPGEEMRHGQRGRSSGFSGTDAQYSELYMVPCASVDDCIAPCTMRGGTQTMCAASECVDSATRYCLPPTTWRNLAALRTEGTDTSDAAELVLVANPYEDLLLVDDFKLEVPTDAEVVGISVTVRRAGGSSMEAADGSVRLIKGGIVGEADRSKPTPWTGPELVNVEYGGPTDLWGETWTPADVNAMDFGVALSAIYLDTAGNGRAYVDIVYVTVHYRTGC
jgi:hypothetical protein